MANGFDADRLAPLAPGYILAPTNFQLAGDPEDFVDWDETTGSLADDHWADDPNCWLLVFRAYDETDKPGRWVRLEEELCIDVQGRQRVVALGKHWARDIRPVPAQAPKSMLFHPWGWRYPKGSKNPHDVFVHWILASPFQLAWKCLPPMDAKDRSCDRTTFEKWASQRGLEHTVVTTEELGRGKVTVAVSAFPEKAAARSPNPGKPVPEAVVACPWTQAYALNRSFRRAQERWVSGFLNDTKRIERKILRSYVRSVEQVVGKERFNRDLFDLLDESAFTEEERTDTEKEDFQPDQLIRDRTALLGYLKSPRFSAMRQDALASPDPRAKATFAEIEGHSVSGLDSVGGDTKFLDSICKANGALFKLEAEELGTEVKTFLDKHPDALHGKPPSLGWKEQRRALKSYWYFVKAFIAQIEWIAPRKLTRDLKAIGREVFGVLIDFDFADKTHAIRMPDGTIRWPRLVVSPEAKARLAKKHSRNPGWNHLFLIIDAYNLLLAWQTQAKGKTDIEPVVAAMGSFLNTAASTIEAGLQRRGVKHLVVTNKMLAEMAKEASESSAKGASKVSTVLRKLNQPKTIGAVGKAFGLLGSLFEASSSLNKAGSARASHDDDAAMGYVASGVANYAVSAGYLVGGVGTVAVMLAGATAVWPLALVAVGSWLVLGGTAADLMSKVYVARVERDPLENWLKTTPWARDPKYRSDDMDELIRSFHKAMVGLRLTVRTGLTGFDVTVESRVIHSPEQVFLEVAWTSEAGQFRNEMAPMTGAERPVPGQLRHKEFTSTVKQVTARVRLLLDGEWYPERPEVVTYPA
jgi:hypothetical protein